MLEKTRQTLQCSMLADLRQHMNMCLCTNSDFSLSIDFTVLGFTIQGATIRSHTYFWVV